MEYRLTEGQRNMREEFRAFAAAEVQPLARQTDAEGRFPAPTIQKLAQKGWLGLPFPIQYGGMGQDTVCFSLLIEELSRACASTGVIVSSHALACSALCAWGSDAQKERFLPALLSGSTLSAFALTEQNAGTDASGVQTTATTDQGSYILNGDKRFITNAGVAGLYVIFAMTAPALGVKGISAILVEADTPGFTLGDTADKMGIRGSVTRELHFKNCRVPRENLLGPKGSGYKIALSTLDLGRIGIASQALGIAQGAFDTALAYVRERKQFGKPLSSFQNTSFRLADMGTQIEAARLLVLDAALARDAGGRFSKQAAMAKLFASETAMTVTTQCVQLMGGNGYTKDFPVERMMRDAKITEIYEGTSEVQRMVVSAALLG